MRFNYFFNVIHNCLWAAGTVKGKSLIPHHNHTCCRYESSSPERSEAFIICRRPAKTFPILPDPSFQLHPSNALCPLYRGFCPCKSNLNSTSSSIWPSVVQGDQVGTPLSLQRGITQVSTRGSCPWSHSIWVHAVWPGFLLHPSWRSVLDLKLLYSEILMSFCSPFLCVLFVKQWGKNCIYLLDRLLLFLLLALAKPSLPHESFPGLPGALLWPASTSIFIFCKS